MDIKTTYSVQYQKQGDDITWWTFMGDVFKDAEGLHNETQDFEHAFSVASRLYDGALHTHKRPQHRDRVTATRVMQLIYAGGVLITFGKPQPAAEEDDDA